MNDQTLNPSSPVTSGTTPIKSTGAIFFWLALVLLVTGGTFIWLGVKYSNRFIAGQSEQPEIETPAKPLPPGSEAPMLERFELTERSGKPIASEDLAGKINVVSFFFASCPASCRTQNHKLAELEREFGKQGVKFLAITCDPKRDTPEVLREYSQIFNAPKDSWYFLTGDLTYTRRIAGEIYGVPLDEKSHVERFILIDKEGKIRGRFAWNDDKELSKLKSTLRDLVAGKEVPMPAQEEAKPKDNEEEAEAEVTEGGA